MLYRYIYIYVLDALVWLSCKPLCHTLIRFILTLVLQVYQDATQLQHAFIGTLARLAAERRINSPALQYTESSLENDVAQAAQDEGESKVCA